MENQKCDKEKTSLSVAMTSGLELRGLPSHSVPRASITQTTKPNHKFIIQEVNLLVLSKELFLGKGPPVKHGIHQQQDRQCRTKKVSSHQEN